MVTIRPTKKQRELLDYIEQFIVEHAYSPSYREIMNGLQYNSVATVALHVSNLIKRGHLRKRDHSARSLEVVREPANDQAEASSSPAEADHQDWLMRRIESRLQQSGSASDGEVLLRALQLLGLTAQADELRAAIVASALRPEPEERMSEIEKAV